FQVLRLTPKILDLAAGRSSCGVAGKAAFAGLQKLFRPTVIQALGNAFTPAQLGNGMLAAQTVQHDPDLLLGRILLAGCPADVFYNPLGRRFLDLGLLSHLHWFMVTMSQKSSFLQAAIFVSQVLIPDIDDGGPYAGSRHPEPSCPRQPYRSSISNQHCSDSSQGSLPISYS